MLKNFIILLFVLLLSSPSKSIANESLTSAENIVKNWQNDNETKAFAIGIVNGIINHNQAIEAVFPNNKSKFFCFTYDASFSNEELLRIIDAEYYKDKSTYSDWEYGLMAIVALKDIYAC